MSNWSIETLTREQASYIYDNLDHYENIEVELAYNGNKEKFLNDLEKADWNLVVLVKGKPIMMFGVCKSELEGHGVPYMLHTGELHLVKKDFIKYCRLFVEKMQTEYDYLINYVHANNTTAIRWLKFCNFKVGKKPVYFSGVPCLPFYRS